MIGKVGVIIVIDYIKKINAHLKQYVWKQEHRYVKNDYQKRYQGGFPTIISCNCIGGILYHELNMQFCSPTINLYMNCEDFLKFCENLNYYLSLEIKEYKGPIKRDYPLGMLGDLLIYFVHYHSLDEAKEKWEKRKKRMDMDNIFIIATDRDGCNYELIKRFSELPYENKKLFAHIPYREFKDVVYITGYENEKELEGLMFKTKGGHYLIDQFDWVKWLSRSKK